MATTFDMKKNACEHLANKMNAPYLAVEFDNIPSLSGGDTVELGTVPTDAAVFLAVVNVEEASTAEVSGQFYIGTDTVGSTINLQVSGATFVHDVDLFETADATLKVLTSGTGAIADGKVAVQLVYSVVAAK